MSSAPRPRAARATLLSVGEITRRLGAGSLNTIYQVIRRLKIAPSGTSPAGRPLYHPRHVERIRLSTTVTIPQDCLSAVQLSRRLDCDPSTVWRLLRKVRLKPTRKLPGGRCYWHESHLPTLRRAMRPARVQA
jgi:hypothetical protein